MNTSINKQEINSGQFVISLDFEKYWGVFDSQTGENYSKNLNSVDAVIERLLTICDTYKIKLTFATVGFLFNKTKQEFTLNTPNALPSYTNAKHNPYLKFEKIGTNEQSDKIHYANGMLKKILENGNHEISTHTYSHYYCLEEGQTITQFEADIKMAIKVGADLGVDIKSIVFPRNQVNQDYFKICHNNGVLSYRGCEKHFIYKPNNYLNSKKKTLRILRLLDAYINITGKHTYEFSSLKSNVLINIPSSSFLRPYYKRLSLLEPLKINRIVRGMKKAAKKNQLYHIWWHPHNFGDNINKNFNNLEKIFKAYHKLNEDYNFQSITMTELALKLKE